MEWSVSQAEEILYQVKNFSSTKQRRTALYMCNIYICMQKSETLTTLIVQVRNVYSLLEF